MTRLTRMTLFTGLILLIVGGGGFGIAILAFPGQVHPLGLATIGTAALGLIFLAVGLLLWLWSLLTR